MNDADKIDLSVTDANNMDWDKHTLVVQCDKCNNPVNLVYYPINKWYNRHEPITRRNAHATYRYPHCTQPR